MAEKNLEGIANEAHDEHGDSASQETGGLEKKVDESFSFGKFVWDAVKLSPIFAASYWLTGPAFLITSAAYGLGHILEKWKDKEKITYKGLKADIWTGALVGLAAYYLYSSIDIINKLVDTTTLVGKVIKTLAFNPLMVLGFSAIYRPFVYIRDNIGLGKFFKGIFTLKAPGYLKEAYEHEAADIVGGTAKYTMLAPMHFYTLNYLQSVPARLAFGGVGDTIYRLIMGSKKKQAYAVPKDNLHYLPQQHRKAA